MSTTASAADLVLSRDAFGRAHVFVVGDVMLDRYWFGDVDRISPEAPVPVVSVAHSEERAGGAANVACNVDALGARCTLLSVTGDDEAGRRLTEILAETGINTVLMVDARAETTVKLRILSRNQQLLRADFESSPDHEVLRGCLRQFHGHLPDVDVVLMSDYGKGGLYHIREMIAASVQAGKPVIVDPKGSDFERYRNASMLTPNIKEFEQVVGSCDGEQETELKARRLMEELDIGAVLLTRGEHGMCLYPRGADRIERGAAAMDVYDVSGAGDTVIGACAVASAAGLNPEQMLLLANAAAGIVVSKLGTATATFDELAGTLGGSN